MVDFRAKLTSATDRQIHDPFWWPLNTDRPLTARYMIHSADHVDDHDNIRAQWSLVRGPQSKKKLTVQPWKIGKIENWFFRPFWGRLGWLTLSYLFFNTAVPFFFKHFFIGWNSGLFDGPVESTLLAGGNSKSYGNVGDPARGHADLGSAAAYLIIWSVP